MKYHDRSNSLVMKMYYSLVMKTLYYYVDNLSYELWLLIIIILVHTLDHLHVLITAQVLLL